jgi:hybrid cluster-associated redox disulfide protein
MQSILDIYSGQAYIRIITINRRIIVMTKITKDTTIGEAIQYDNGIIGILMGAGMHCVGCPSSAGETLEEAAQVHGLDCDELLNDIHDYLQSVG